MQSVATPPLAYDWLDVFTDVPCGGNPLAVVYGAEGLSDAAMQRIAREFNLSETTFVLPPEDPKHTACVRIFTPTAELPFAGHPNIGTAVALSLRGSIFDKPVGGRLIFEEKGGNVSIDMLTGRSAQLTAPMPFVLSAPSEGIPRAEAAAALGLAESQLRSEGRVACIGGSGYTLVELVDQAALAQCAPDFAAIALLPPAKVLAWVQVGCVMGKENKDGEEGHDICCRMFTARGTEDAATGAASCCLLGLLAMETGGQGKGGCLHRRVSQGVEMGRPSTLLGECQYDERGAPTSVKIAGSSVLLMSGSIQRELFALDRSTAGR